MLKYAVSGNANETGFMIRIDDDIYSTKNFLEQDEEEKNGFLIVIIGFILTIAVSGIIAENLTNLFKMGPLWGLILFFAMFISWSIHPFWLTICQLFVLPFQMSKTTKGWHACEHKTIHLITKDKELTMENLRQESRLTPHDGMMLILKYLMNNITIAIIIILCIVSLSAFLNDNLLVLVSLMPICLLVPFVLLIIITFSDILFYLPVIALQLLTTTEPEEWQLRESLEIAQKIKEDRIYKFKKDMDPLMRIFDRLLEDVKKSS